MMVAFVSDAGSGFPSSSLGSCSDGLLQTLGDKLIVQHTVNNTENTQVKSVIVCNHYEFNFHHQPTC